VAEGVPFRDAYRQGGQEIMRGDFKFSGELHHTHEGSIGNLCNARIRAKMDKILGGFDFERVRDAERSLLGNAR